jgi:hypothetical protein
MSRPLELDEPAAKQDVCPSRQALPQVRIEQLGRRRIDRRDVDRVWPGDRVGRRLRRHQGGNMPAHVTGLRNEQVFGSIAAIERGKEVCFRAGVAIEQRHRFAHHQSADAHQA